MKHPRCTIADFLLEGGRDTQQLRIAAIATAFGLREAHILGYLFMPLGGFSSIGYNLLKEMADWCIGNELLGANNASFDVTQFQQMDLNG